jgi:hypothetical protein
MEFLKPGSGHIMPGTTVDCLQRAALGKVGPLPVGPLIGAK